MSLHDLERLLSIYSSYTWFKSLTSFIHVF